MAVAVICTAGGASAQTVTVQNLAPTRALPGGGAWGPRGNAFNPTWVSYADCENDISLTFAVATSGFAGNEYYLQAWASTSGDCTTASARGINNAAGQSCWPVSAQMTPNETNPSNPITLYARDLARFISGSGTDPTNVSLHGLLGASFNPNAARPEAWCHGQLQDTGVPVTIAFAVQDSTGNDVSGAQDGTYGNASTGSSTTGGAPSNFQVDLVAPAAPTGVSGGIEDTALLISWNLNNPATGQPYSQEVPEVAGFALFMDPPPASFILDAGGDAANAAGDAGATDAAADAPSPVYLECDDASALAGEAGTDAAADAGFDSGFDAGGDARFDAAVEDASDDASADAFSDSSEDAGTDATLGDGSVDGGADATLSDAGSDADEDAGFAYPHWSLWDGSIDYPSYCHRVSGANPIGEPASQCTISAALAAAGAAGAVGDAGAEGGSDAGTACTFSSTGCLTAINYTWVCSDAGIQVQGTACSGAGQFCIPPGAGVTTAECVSACPSSFAGTGCVGGTTTTSWSCIAGDTTPSMVDCDAGEECSAGTCITSTSTTTDGGGGAGGIIGFPTYNNIAQPGMTAPAGLLVQTNLGSAATQMQVTGLTDGVNYDFAIAVIDDVGNIGPLSYQACQTPQPVNDFWTLYVDAGGLAGGGFCSIQAPGAVAARSEALGPIKRRWPLEPSLFGLCVFGALGALVRRRRNK